MANLRTNLDTEPQWYVLKCFAGYENVAKQNLENTIDKFNLQNRIFQIVIPMQDELVEKRGKKVLVPKKIVPGYILVKMIYGDDIWHAVIHTEYINSFVGPKGRPQPITEEEARHMGVDGGKTVDAKLDLDVNVGDIVEIIDGSLASFVGTVKSVDKDAQKVVAMVEMFGRESEVELGFNQIRIKN